MAHVVHDDLGEVPHETRSAFELFGMKFFESKEDTAPVIDPVSYTLTLDPCSDFVLV